MARTAKTLQDHVLSGTFRTNRHGPLLADGLPTSPPRSELVELWGDLRLLCAGFSASRSDDERRALVLRFAAIAAELRSRLHRGPAITLEEQMFVTLDVGLMRVDRRGRAWQTKHGPLWRQRHGIRLNADVDRAKEIEDDGRTIPTPPGLSRSS